MSNTTTICPVCDEDVLSEKRYSDQFECGKHTITVYDLEGYLCSVCGAEPIFPKQILRGQLKIADAKRRGANAFSKYERGDVLQSEAMDKLLRVAAGQ